MAIPQAPGPIDHRAIESVENCPICSSGNIHFLLWGKSRYAETWFRYNRCGECGGVFVGPRIPESDLTQALAGRRHSYVKYLPTRDYDRAEADLNLVVPALRLHPKWQGEGHRWLDIGCGIGNLLEAAKARGCRSYGLDADTSLTGWASENTSGIEFSGIPLDQRPFDPPFDFISADNVLEHINQPRPFLGSIHQALDGNGLLVLRVPNYNSIFRSLISLRGKLPTSFVIDPDAHPVNYTSRALHRLLDITGFKPVQTMEHLMFSYITRRVFNHLNAGGGRSIQSAMIRFLPTIRILDRVIPLGGLNVTVFARKK